MRARVASIVVCLTCACWIAAAPAQAICVADCDGGGSTAVNEIIVCLNIALELAPAVQCEPCDGNDDGWVAVDDVVGAVNAALNGCAELSEGACRTGSDCDQPLFWCLAPGEFAGCGICFGHNNPYLPCKRDEDCDQAGGVSFCGELGPENNTCSPCSGPLLACLSGCASDDECEEGESCDETHRCVARACDAGDDCPLHFDCVIEGPDAPHSTCGRRSCATDGQCDGGYCVQGLSFLANGKRCFAQPGRCILPPA